MSFVSASSTAHSSEAPQRTAATQTAAGNDQQVNRPALVGRFAPSPSGPLHFGSLVSALASYLDVKSGNGRWLLRIDDLDTPRSQPGSEDAILATLAAHHLHWDDTPSRQTNHLSAYQQALDQLAAENLLFFCNCSRKSLRATPVYPGTCHSKLCSPADLQEHLQGKQQRQAAIRIRVPDVEIHCHDELQGNSTTALGSASGDYIVFRRDGLVSYQLAVVVDDMLTGVNRVVRGADLLPTTPRQQHLHTVLGSTPPAWLHLPVLLNQQHTKLSKQSHSLPVDNQLPSTNLNIGLQLLGQNPPPDAHRMPAAELVSWACAHWQPTTLPVEETFSTFVGW